MYFPQKKYLDVLVDNEPKNEASQVHISDVAVMFVLFSFLSLLPCFRFSFYPTLVGVSGVAKTLTKGVQFYKKKLSNSLVVKMTYLKRGYV